MRKLSTVIVVVLIAIVLGSASRQRVDLEKFNIVDLSSPHQNVRDTAAAYLRKLILTGRTSDGAGHIREHDSLYWAKKITGINLRDTLRAVLSSLQLKEESDEMGMCNGRTCSGNFRLDNSWVLTLYYESNEPLMVFDDTLIYSPRNYFITPNDTFSGTWVTYYVNGQRAYSIDYVSGVYSGVFSTFHHNGQLRVQQHYIKGHAHGEDRGYYYSGALMYVGQYVNDKQDGDWIHYFENGQVQSKRSYVKGEIHGVEVSYFENGQRYWESEYNHGKQLRHRAWDKEGKLVFDTESEK